VGKINSRYPTWYNWSSWCWI